MTTKASPRPVAEIHAEVLHEEERFRCEVMEPCQPVLIRGGFSGWPVVRAAGESIEKLREYIARFATDVPAEAFVGAPAIAGHYSYGKDLKGFNFERVEIDVLGALDRIIENGARPGSPTMYIGSLETDVFLPGLSKENGTRILSPAISPRIWLGNASNVSCHNDTFDNIACVVAGRRRFTLYPPEAIADLYIGPIDHTMAGRPTSLAASSPPGDPRFPRFAMASERALVADLLPGDVLYIPKLWWHQVEATEAVNVLVNYWWDGWRSGPDTPDTAMMLAMIAIGERPPAERAAWKALFDHYVFRPEGHPLAHLPAEQHGILGPLRDNYGRIRAHVMRMLRGG